MPLQDSTLVFAYRYDCCMLRGLFRKKKDKIGGISILLLQKRLERFSTERLNVAMQGAWRRSYDPQSFFAVSIFAGDGATLKVGRLHIAMRHFDRRLEGEKLGDQELPDWAAHSAYSSIEYNCPGGIPEGEIREKMYGFLALLCAELLDVRTSGIFFTEERVAIPNSQKLRQKLRSGDPVNPRTLASEIVLA